MPIHPLPQFELDLAEHDREVYERLKPPSSVVVRFGATKMIGEFPYSGDAKPGCGSKLVVKTHRGTEIGEMLTSTCPNAGCSKSVTRQEMLQYIENSGGREYPFFSMQGKVLRIATVEDLNEQARLEATRPQLIRSARAISERLGLNMKIVDAEPILGGERLTFYFTSEDRVDFRELVSELAAMHHARIEMRQVGARDEARLVADYERCGQHCCCKQFLKVLKPVSMKSAKIQKATLDPLKISGRCGRLMCCLRYEDETYDQLRARLPRKKARVKTPEGWGVVLDGQILTQLVLVQMDSGEQVAVPVEEIEVGGAGAPPVPPPSSRDGPPPPARGSAPPAAGADGSPGQQRRGPQPPRPRTPAAGHSPVPPKRPAPPAAPASDEIDLDDIETDLGDDRPAPQRPRRDGRRGGGGGGGGGDGGRGRGGGGPNAGPRPEGGPPSRPRFESRPQSDGDDQGGGAGPQGEGRRRRRRRRRGGPGGGEGGGGGGGGGGSGGGGPAPGPGAG